MLHDLLRAGARQVDLEHVAVARSTQPEHPRGLGLAGRVDRIPDDDGRILGPDDEVITLDDDVAAEARATPCRDRVSERAVPAAILLVVATVLGVAAFAVELIVVRPRQRREMRAAMAPPEPSGGPPGGSGG